MISAPTENERTVTGMAKYIEREAISEEIRKYYYKNPPNFSYGEGFDRGLDRAQRAILDAPAADVELVVRCRECKHHCRVQEPCHGKSVHYCKLPHMRGIEIFKEFFCYYGERKEGAD